MNLLSVLFLVREGPLRTQIVLELFMGAIILTGHVNDFCTVISGDMRLWENLFLMPKGNFTSQNLKTKQNSVMVSGQMSGGCKGERQEKRRFWVSAGCFQGVFRRCCIGV